MSYNTPNYTEQGGAVTHIGGKLIIETGAEVEGLPAPDIPEASETTKGIVKSCTNQTASEAADISTLVTDFNALLTKLKAAGLMTPDT